MKKSIVDNIEKLKRIAAMNNGTLLNYNSGKKRDKAVFQCKRGHIFDKYIFKVIKSKSWCIKCIKIEELILFQKIARRQGGECLSTEYINRKTKIKFKCREGHIWEAYPHNVIRGHWCAKCKRNSNNIKIELSEFKI